MGGLGRDGAETEIDHNDRQDLSHLRGIFGELIDDIPADSPVRLERKLQFDPAECGLNEEESDKEFEETVAELLHEDYSPKNDDDEIMDTEDTDLFGIPQAETEQIQGGFVVPLGEVPKDLPPSDEVPVEDMLENQLDDEIEKSSKESPCSNEGQKKCYKSSEKARENSRNWHKKWIKKGVPREDKNTKPVPKSKITKEKSKGIPSSGLSSSSQPAKSLAQAKDFFITKWIEGCGMEPSNDRRAAAIQAWMNSSERSDFIAGQKGSQK